MACQALKLEPTKHEKACLATFKKRKNSLVKKAYEFTTLCDVELCIIIYGPKVKGQSLKPETWTLKEGELTSIIRKYEKKISAIDHGQHRPLSLSKFDESKMRQVDDATTRACKKICVGDFTTWDQGMDSLSEDQLKMILSTMDDKLKDVDRKLNMIKRDQNVVNKATSRKLEHDHSNDAKSLVNLQPAYQGSQKLPSDSSFMEIQCGGGSGSTIPFTPLQGQINWNSSPTMSPTSSGIYDGSAAQAKKSNDILKDQSSQEE